MRYVIQHNGETQTTKDLPNDFTLDQIKAQAAQLWPEVANSTPELDGNVITFRLTQGSKA